MSNLFIVESPNKCAKIKSFLGKDYEVIASVGHIVEIPKKGLNIDIKNKFKAKYDVIDSKKDIVKKIKSYVDKSSVVYLASDPDREGSRISNDIYELLSDKNKKKCFRVSFNEITKKAIENAIKNKRTIQDDIHLIDAQKARQVIDRIVGYRCSPLLWFSVNAKSAGRVQSVALKILAERESEIKAFVPSDFWYIESLLQNDNGEFWAKVVTKDKDNRFTDEPSATKAFEALKNASYAISKIQRSTKERKAYPPFDTTSLQSACSSLFGWNATKTMQIAQDLYASGKISYHRTDCYAISQEALDSVRNYIKNNFDAKYLSVKPNIYAKKSSAAAQEAHEAIRAVHIEDEGKELDSDHKKMYCLIRDRFIACQMTPMIVDTVTYDIKTDSKYNLIAKGQTVAFDGWFKVYKYSKAEEEVLPNAKENEKLNLKDIKKTKHTTQPPKRYNDGSLILKMEADGIGRPSTRATILKTLVDRGYSIKEKGKSGSFIVTDLGMRVHGYLEPRFNKSFMDIKYTAQMEEDLDLIANGKKTYLNVVENVYNTLTEEIKNAKGIIMEKQEEKLMGQKCTECKDGQIVEKTGRFGTFYSCNKFPDCKSIFVKQEDGSFTLKVKKTVRKVGRKCPECGADLVERTAKKSGDIFVACSGFPSCRFIEKNA